VGRTKKEINWDVVEKKVEAGCSAAEIYEFICHRDTFYDRFKEHFGENFADYSTRVQRVGPGNVKYLQYMKMLSGNIPMMQLLGREWLGQGKEEVKASPLDESIAIRHENMMLRAEIDKLKETCADKPKAE
jgi:hypothetical protein